MAIDQGLMTGAAVCNLLFINLEMRDSFPTMVPWDKICYFHTHPGGEFDTACNQDWVTWEPAYTESHP